MTDREKIIEIIKKTVLITEGVYRLTDLLIANGIGDVSEWKRRAEVAEQNAMAWKDCANKWQKYYKEQAEKELQEDRKDD